MSDIYQDEIDEENTEKQNGRLYSHEVLFEIVSFFKSSNNEWASRSETIDYLKQFFNTTGDSLWGHIYRVRTKYGILEYDEGKKSID